MSESKAPHQVIVLDNDEDFISLLQSELGAYGFEIQAVKPDSNKIHALNLLKTELIIIDDGKGFDVSKLTRVESSGRGAGLFTMRERCHLAGGEGFVESQPGKGTKATARLPINRDDLNEEN